MQCDAPEACNMHTHEHECTCAAVSAAEVWASKNRKHGVSPPPPTRSASPTRLPDNPALVFDAASETKAGISQSSWAQPCRTGV